MTLWHDDDIIINRNNGVLRHEEEVFEEMYDRFPDEYSQVGDKSKYIYIYTISGNPHLQEAASKPRLRSYSSSKSSSMSLRRLIKLDKEG